MNDNMDVYLGRSLKNWAAKHQPPADGRERLLQLAAAPPLQRQRGFPQFLTTLKNHLSYSESALDEYFCGEWITVPISQSRSWSLHMTAGWRLAT